MMFYKVHGKLNDLTDLDTQGSKLVEATDNNEVASKTPEDIIHEEVEGNIDSVPAGTGEQAATVAVTMAVSSPRGSTKNLVYF